MKFTVDIETRRVTTNGVALDVHLAGPADGPPVVMLHGFPDFWYGWRHQIGPLADAGFRVIVPDQRGYNRSEKPAGLKSYDRDTLVADIIGLLDALGIAKARFVVHDWGGVVGWWLTIKHPERVERLVVCNIPHPKVFAKALKTFRQVSRMWYAGVFQIPWLPERLLAARRAAALRVMLRASAAPGTYSEEDLERYTEAWLQPGAIRGMVSWYRAVRIPTVRVASMDVVVPTLVLWGTRDPVLGEELAGPSAACCKDVKLVLLPDASHFPQHEAPERVTTEILAFFAS